MPYSQGASPATVLVIDDEPPARAGLADALRGAGFAVREAGTGAEALCPAGERPDLVLLDPDLPDADGYDLVRRLRADPATAALPILLLSGRGARTEERVRGLEAGADGYLAKPADPAEVVAQVKALLRLRRRAEEDLWQSREEYRVLTESVPRLVWTADPGGALTYVNRRAMEYAGLPRESALGWDWTRLVYPDDLARTLEAWAAARKEGREYADEYRLRRGDGAYRWHAARAAPLRDREGRVVKWVGACTDIDDQMRAAEALRASEERYRELFEANPHPMWVSDTGTLRFLAVNDAAVRQYGFSRGEFLAMTLADIRPPEDVPGLLADLAKPTADLRAKGVWRHRWKDGTVRDVEVSTRDFRYGGRPARLALAVDVTERRRAEAELRQTAELLRAVADGTTDAVFVKDLSGRYLLFNEAAGRFVGRPPAEVLGKDDTELFDADSAARVMGRDRRIIESGRAETAEERLTAAGVTRTYLATKAPYRDDRGNVVGLIGISRDVTERERLAAERDALLARLQLQIGRMPLAYVLLDADLRVTEWNPAAEELFGYRKEEVLGRDAGLLLVAPEDVEHVREINRRLRAGDMAAHSVNRNRTKDGRVITCRWFNTPLADAGGAFAGLLALAEDVTRQRQAEEDLLLRERALESASQGIIITDAGRPDHPVIYANPAFERLTGYPRAEVLGRNGRLLQGPGTDPAAVAELRRAVREGRPYSAELLNYKKDGTPFWNALSVSPVRDAAGNLTHFVGVQTDVTERRKLEEQYRQAQKMEVVGRLAGGVAHDFNNLLTVITGYGEMVLAGLPPGDPSREPVGEMVKAGERAAALTGQLLAFSRQQVLAPRVLCLNEVVTDLEKILRRVIGEDVDLEARLHPELDPVKADPGQLEQVLLNLAVNARDAMPRGGRLTVETRNVELDGAYAGAHAGAAAGRYVLLAVSDTGVGMTQEVRARVFEPFFTTKGPGKGTGLGLATVHGIVTQSGGRVEVYSEPGRGSTFKVYLPRAGGPVPAGRSHNGVVPAARGTETVLLAEDEGAVRALSRHVLETHGYTVLEAADGEEALRLCAGSGGAVDILVSDVVMPGLGGRELAERLRARQPGLRVLYLSGYADDAVIRHGVLEAEVDFLQKPFSAAALARKVREVLDG